MSSKNADATAVRSDFFELAEQALGVSEGVYTLGE